MMREILLSPAFPKMPFIEHKYQVMLYKNRSVIYRFEKCCIIYPPFSNGHRPSKASLKFYREKKNLLNIVKRSIFQTYEAYEQLWDKRSGKHTLCGQAVGASEGFRGGVVHGCEGVKTPSRLRGGRGVYAGMPNTCSEVDPPLFSWEETGCVGR